MYLGLKKRSEKTFVVTALIISISFHGIVVSLLLLSIIKNGADVDY